MNKWLKHLKSLPIKWKITLWSSSFLFILFVSYNILQYIVVDHRALYFEKQNARHQLNEVLAFIQANNDPLSLEQIKENKDYLSEMNENNQLIRILDQKGNIVISVSNESSESWPLPVVGKNKEYKVIKKKGDLFLVLHSPVATSRFHGTIEIVKDMEIVDDFMKNIFLIMIVASIGGLILSFLGGTILSKKLLSNVQVMTETMKKIKTNRLEERVPVNGTNDEFAQLGTLFNRFMDDLEESFIQQKQFVEDASHELRTPLSIIKGHLNLLDRWGKNDPKVLDKSLKSSLKEVDRLIKLVQELLELSRAENSTLDPTEMSTIHLNNVIQLVIKNFEVLHSDYTFYIENNDENLYAAISARHLEQILIILLDNAVKYSKERKEITVTCSSENNKAYIKVIDYGIGIPEQDIPYVLNRFYRVDKARSRKQGGLGLGLAIAKRWVEKYDGTLNIESKEEEGTTIIITFPLNQ